MKLLLTQHPKTPLQALKARLLGIKSNFSSLSRRKKYSIAIFLGFAIGVIVTLPFFATQSIDTKTKENVPLVFVQSINKLNKVSREISLIGSVRSVSEATIRTETSGRILYVSYALSDSISSGAVIAEIENAREMASLQEARATLTASKATLNKTREALKRGETDTRERAVSTYRNAFVLASDAVFGKTDTLFSSARTSAPRLNINPFGRLGLEKERARINDILAVWEGELGNTDTDKELKLMLSKSKSSLGIIRIFLDQLASIVNRQEATASRSQTTLDAEKVAVFSARTNVNTAIVNVTGALNNLSATLFGNSGGTGESDATLMAAEATVEQSRARVTLSLANLEKTIIRAPISGTINMLDLEKGNFVGSFAPVVVIANNGALEIVAYASGDDRKLIRVGSDAVIEDLYKGVVTKVASALNPETKKLEVRIGVSEDTPELINGDTVRLAIIVPAVKTSERKGTTETEATRIPISALKLIGQSAFVFSVTPEKTLTAHPVKIIRIMGETVEIEPIDRNLRIVIDARGLTDGEAVNIGSL